jgi:hypothetical protein
MIIDFKYHIASLVAVFLALGIGILIGSAMGVGNEVVSQQQEKLIDSLQRDFTGLREQNRQAAAELQVAKTESGIYEEFANRIFPVLTVNRLTGKRVAVVETNRPGMHGELSSALHQAGAEVTSFTSLVGDLQEPGTFEQVAAFLKETRKIEEASSADVAGEIAATLISGEGIDLISYLESLDILKVSGQYGVPVDAVIVIGGGTDKDSDPRSFDLPLMKHLRSQEIAVVGVEDSDVTVSFMKSYQVQDITTIDNIDTIPGQTALILALQGQPGDYGIKPTAKQLMPLIQG